LRISDCGLRCAPRRTAAGAAIVLAAFSLVVAKGQQPSQPEAQIPPLTASSNADDTADLAEGLRLLQDVRDNVFSFDDPAFYWFCQYVRRRPETANTAADESPLPWRFLFERPTDYRGRLILVEGILQSRQTYEVTNRPGVGTLHQCELSDPTTRAICTVVSTDDPGEIPIRSLVRASGYFIKVRAYKTTTGEPGAGPLLVAKTLVPFQGPPPGDLGSRPLTGPLSSRKFSWIVWATAALAVVWLVLRRRCRPASSRDTALTNPSVGRQTSDSKADFDWLPPSDDNAST